MTNELTPIVSLNEASPAGSAARNAAENQEDNWRSKDPQVGYGRPPKASQFKKGQSGNPAGRRKVRKSFRAMINEALDEKVTISENGESKRITKRGAAAKQLANKVAKGDLPSLKLLQLLLTGAEIIEEPPTPVASTSAKALLAKLLLKETGQDFTDGS